jgi:hypothetical protein
MKRYAPLAAIAAALAFAAPAQAVENSPSDAYCESSLRGQTSLAPDNDIKRDWDTIEVLYGYNIVRSFRSGLQRDAYNSVYEQFTFVRGNGTYAGSIWYHCWRDYTGTYHDQ